MAALLSTRFPHKAPELFAYSATIARAERNYEHRRWVAYDRQLRREALAKKCLDWSVPDPRLYSEAFTVWARSIPRCSLCLQVDHQANSCPQNHDQPWCVWPFGAGTAGASPAHQSILPRTPRKPAKVCRRYNEGRCRPGMSTPARSVGAITPASTVGSFGHGQGHLTDPQPPTRKGSHLGGDAAEL